MDLSKEIKDILEEYGEEVSDAMKEIVPKVAKDAVKKLRSNSPKNTGVYARGWTQRTEKGNLTISSTVYNSKKPGLPHLLEYGHAKRNGGRTRPEEHIKPVEEWVQEETVRKIEEELR